MKLYEVLLRTANHVRKELIEHRGYIVADNEMFLLGYLHKKHSSESTQEEEYLGLCIRPCKREHLVLSQRVGEEPIIIDSFPTEREARTRVKELQDQYEQFWADCESFFNRHFYTMSTELFLSVDELSKEFQIEFFSNN